MVKVKSPAVGRVRAGCIEPRAVCRGAVVGGIPVHRHKRTLTKGMIKDHVGNNRNALAVAGIHELFELLGAAVELV